MTLETAALETPASSATSEMDGRFFAIGSTCSDIGTPPGSVSHVEARPIALHVTGVAETG